MATPELETTARAIVADGKGILAADETPGTLTKRLTALGIESTPDTRRAYREMFFSTQGVAEFISGVILQDETIRQRSSKGTPLADLLAGQGIIPGIKVDLGAKPLAGFPGEHITEGLDGLRGRLEEYRAMGARFAKWRAVIEVSDTLPTAACVQVNAHALARYAVICQEQAIVPIVEPEVLMDGSHTIERCEEVTGHVLHAVFDALFEQKVSLEGMLLKPNMVISGNRVRHAGHRRRGRPRHGPLSPASCAGRRPRHRVPVGRPGSPRGDDAPERDQSGRGTEAVEAQLLLRARAAGRSAQRLARTAGEPRSRTAGFHHRAKCDSAAALGRYTTSMETESVVA